VFRRRESPVVPAPVSAFCFLLCQSCH
jgi:hypothetical protein